VKSISRTSAFVFLSGVAACGVFGAGDSESTPESPPRVDAEAETAVDAAVQPVIEAGGADATLPTLCDPSMYKTETALSEADGLIAESSNQAFGALSICNTSVGRCLVRFPLSNAVRTAFGAKKVVTMTVTLRRADSDLGCGVGISSCVALRESGQLSVVPARVDWEESQMTWNVARAGTNWGISGAGQVGTDIGGLGGSAVIAATDLNPTVSLDPTKWTGPGDFLATPKLALRFELLDGTTRRQFVSVTHEIGALPHEPPKLTLTYCP